MHALRRNVLINFAYYCLIHYALNFYTTYYYTGAPFTPRSHYLAQPHLVLDHQYLLIAMNYLSLKWRIVNGDNCIYNLVVIDSSCDSSTKIILNETMNNSLILRYDNGESADTGNFWNSSYNIINITSYTREGNQCGFLERLHFATSEFIKLLVRIEDCSICTEAISVYMLIVVLNLDSSALFLFSFLFLSVDVVVYMNMDFDSL